MMYTYLDSFLCIFTYLLSNTFLASDNLFKIIDWGSHYPAHPGMYRTHFNWDRLKDLQLGCSRLPSNTDPRYVLWSLVLKSAMFTVTHDPNILYT